jgi:ABC-type multidrug transport system fused ATPase/permease subunit
MQLTAGLGAEAYDRVYSDTQLIKRSAVYFRPHMRTVLIVAFVVVLISGVATGTPFLIARGIDMLAGNRGLQILLGLAGLVTLLGVLNWVFNLVRVELSARAVGDVVLALRADAFHALMRHDMSFYDKYAAGRVVSRVTSDTQDFATVITLTVDLLSQAVLLAVITVVLLTINLQLALITLTVAPIVVLVAMGFRRIARRVMQQAQRAQANLNATIHETINGIAVAKNFRQEGTIYADFRAINSVAYRVMLTRMIVFGSIHPIMHAISGTAIATVVFAGGTLALGGSVSVGEWYLFVQSLSLFMMPVITIASFWGQFQQGLAASERVFALIDATPHVVQTGHEPVAQVRGEIRFAGVDFRYRPVEEFTPALPLDTLGSRAAEGLKVEGASTQSTLRTDQPSTFNLQPSTNGEPSKFNIQPATDGNWVLHNFNLHIPAGETLAIVGHTGAGKSSLIKLITRFYEFEGGQLLIDGRDIRRLDLAQYRRRIGLVPQAPFLFSGSVLDNIRYGRPDASDAEVEAAARRLGDGSWVDSLPGGLGSDVGERGARLSFGQRQLVALVRVLLQDPAILLLDEATASIDPLTEAQIQAGLAAVLRGRTSIVIAHRLSTVRNADRIIVLRQGQIIEEGNHEELLVRNGHYAELYATYFRHQSLDYKPWEA